jgi:hypothetical protein
VIPPLSLDALRSIYTTLVGHAEDCTVGVGDCFFHTVEALVEMEEVEGIDPMLLFVLRAFEFADPADVEHLDGVLHIGRQVMRQMLNGMAADGLVATELESAYCLTDLGRNALDTGQVIRRVSKRRIFRFLHPAMSYLAVHDPKGNLLSDLSPDRVPSPWEFSSDVLRHAISQSAEWKRRHGFPANVSNIITQPRSSEEAGPANAKAGLASIPAEPSQSQTTPSQHLVVDKAQVVTCAFVVRQGNVDDVELSGYPVSVHGNLVRGKGQPLFSLRDPDDVGQVFPRLLEPPTPREVADGWLTLATRLMLPEAEQAKVRFEDNTLVITLLADQLDRWMNFVLLAMQDQLYCQVPQTPLLKLCKVAVVGADSAAIMRLQVLRGVLSLERDAQRGVILRSEDALREWLAAREVPRNSSSRDLADVAFWFGRYRLAYEISELEDMNDATV